jgi:hypothetical protein
MDVSMGLDPDTRYYLALSVVGMGDISGVDIAQTVHEDVLRRGGCMLDAEKLTYGRPVPLASTWEGAYVDDHLVVHRLPRQCAKCIRGSFECSLCAREALPHRDQAILEASEVSYAEHSLPRTPEKAFRYQQKFECWGTIMDAHRGHVSSPADKLRQIARLGLWFMRVALLGC